MSILILENINILKRLQFQELTGLFQIRLEIYNSKISGSLLKKLSRYLFHDFFKIDLCMIDMLAHKIFLNHFDCLAM